MANRKNFYIVRLRKDDSIVAAGDAEECTKALGFSSADSFRMMVSRSRMNLSRYSKYDVDIVMDEDKYGKWLFSSINDPAYRICDKCGCSYKIVENESDYNFCPNCGQPMCGGVIEVKRPQDLVVHTYGGKAEDVENEQMD